MDERDKENQRALKRLLSANHAKQMEGRMGGAVMCLCGQGSGGTPECSAYAELRSKADRFDWKASEVAALTADKERLQRQLDAAKEVATDAIQPHTEVRETVDREAALGLTYDGGAWDSPARKEVMLREAQAFIKAHLDIKGCAELMADFALVILELKNQSVRRRLADLEAGTMADKVREWTRREKRYLATLERLRDEAVARLRNTNTHASFKSEVKHQADVLAWAYAALSEDKQTEEGK